MPPRITIGRPADVRAGTGTDAVRVGAPPLQDMASGAGLDLERARAAVHRLLHAEPKILHELPGSDPSDPGPTYELAALT